VAGATDNTGGIARNNAATACSIGGTGGHVRTNFGPMTATTRWLCDSADEARFLLRGFIDRVGKFAWRDGYGASTVLFFAVNEGSAIRR